MQPVDSGLIDELEGFIPRLLTAMRIPGLNIAVARRGKVIWERGFGYSNVTRRHAMTPDTVWMSGSMGKTYTAIAILQLVESGQLRLDTAVDESLTFPVENPLGRRKITIQDLLTHVSGLGESGACCSLTAPEPLHERLRRYLAGTGADFWRGSVPLWVSQVGEEFHYSNTGMALLGLVVERVNREKLGYGRYLQHHLIEPLGMTSTVYPDGDYSDPEVVPVHIREQMSTGYAALGSVSIPTPRIFIGDFPAGQFLSIPRDNVRVLLAMLNGGELDGARVLQPATAAMMLAPRVARPANSRAAPAQVVALGWMTGGAGSRAEWFGHGGGHMWGWSTGYRAYPRLDLAIAVGTNQWALDAQLSGASVSAAPALIAQLAAEFVAQQYDGKSLADRSCGWKISYGAGLVLALSTYGLLGIERPLGGQRGEPVMDGVLSDDASAWDSEGFLQALSDVEDVDLTLEGAAAFLDSDKCALPSATRDAVWSVLGGVGPFPFPLTLGRDAW